jgi:hypothetical protein
VVAIAAALAAVGYKGYTKGMDHWLLGYIAWARGRADAAPGPRPIHVMFLTADHFEVGRHTDRIGVWVKQYPKMASAHRDADGIRPQHTWFYPIEQFDARQVAALDELCRGRYGEIELHLHHSHDTAASLKRKFDAGKKELAGLGALVTDQPRPQSVFAFAHGNMSLDNSRGDAMCGVNSELTVLQQEGCFADFTFPSIERRSQPTPVNELYYAVDDPQRAGSYLAGGAEMEVGRRHPGLLIFEGPLLVDFSNWSHIFYPALDVADLGEDNPPSPHRVDLWVQAGIHVRGRPEWVFVKTLTHGGVPSAWPNLLGKPADRMFSYLESRYNDGRSYVLHYVTAREAYNIAKAAEAGKRGNPARYRDFLIKPYRNRVAPAAADKRS